MKKHLLLVYYHPVIFDLAETFLKIFDKVTIACNHGLNDSYGDFGNVVQSARENEHLSNVVVMPLNLAIVQIKKFDLVGVDGVFDGDQLVMQVCKENKIPWFCINGYPNQFDEPSENILSFSWHLPQFQYKQSFSHDIATKTEDWRAIAETGRSPGKNICVFYPEMNEAKRSSYIIEKEIGPLFPSFIHRYKECNYWTFEVYARLQNIFAPDVCNFSGLSKEEVYFYMKNSSGLLHLKHGDCPGISVLESLIFGKPVFTMSSFVKSSFNQEVLIDGFNAIVADSVDELISRMTKIKLDTRSKQFKSEDIKRHSWMLTDFSRQKHKLEKFFERCMK